MWNNHERSRNLTTGVWLIGLGILFATRQWWPGILFLAGAAALIQAYRAPDRRSSIRPGLILILVGIWAMARFSLTFLMIGLGVWMVFSAIRIPQPTYKPYIDQRLD